MTELIIDNFAGGGGASHGMHLATGRYPDAAINHDPQALEMYAANHPGARVLCENVWKVSPAEVCAGRDVGLAWFSPDCKHFSRAKGARPVNKNIRGLAWVAAKWARDKRPRIIVLENVREFLDWGPLIGDRPDPKRKGLTFRRFVGTLRNMGYRIEWRVLNAADYGSPTHRRRLFLIGRCDADPIVWPEPTHADPAKINQPRLFAEPLKPWRTAAECIDWSIPCPSIFDRKRPLAEKTMKRIAMGMRRYVLDNPRPFIVRIGQTGGGGSYTYEVHQPLSTITSKAEHCLVTPLLAHMTHGGDRCAHPVTEPVPTITGAHRGEIGLIAPCIAKFRGDSAGSAIDAPLPTITSGDGAARPAGAAHALGLIAPTLIECAHGEPGRWGDGTKNLNAPLGTIHAGGKNHALVSAFLTQFFGSNQGKGDLREPIPAVTAGGKKAGLVYAFLTSYYGNDAHGNAIDAPLRTTTTRDRHGLVMVHIDGWPWIIVDIGLRMLTPRELARAQGFPDSYILTGSKSNQVAKIGNSVPPQLAEAIVRANFTERRRREEAA